MLLGLAVVNSLLSLAGAGLRGLQERDILLLGDLDLRVCLAFKVQGSGESWQPQL